MWRKSVAKRNNKSAFLENPNNYGFNQQLGTYCVLRDGYFAVPVRPVRLRNIRPLQMRAMMLSNIIYFRTGRRDPMVFQDTKYLQSAAMHLGVW